MSFAAGAEPAGFGCSVSKTGRKLGRRSLYTSLLSSESSSGCRRNSGIVTPAGGGVRSDVVEDFDALHSDELLRLYLEEPGSNQPEDGWVELYVNRLRGHFCSFKDRTLAFVTSFKGRKVGQRTCTHTHGNRKAEGERPGEVCCPLGGTEGKTSLLSTGAADARTTSRRFWRRLVVGKGNGALVFLPLCAAAIFCFAFALLWFREEGGEEEIPRARVLLHTTRNAADDSLGVPQRTVQQWAQHSELHPNHARERGRRATQAGTRYPSQRLRTTGVGRDNVENTGGGPTLVDSTALATRNESSRRIPLRRWKRSREPEAGNATAYSLFSAELLQHLMMAVAQREQKLPLGEAGPPDATTPLQTDVVIRDFMNTQYVIELDIGTPLQSIRAIADTGSSDFWTCSEKCGAMCMLHNVYKHSKSSTYQPDNSPYNITYIGGPVSGFLSVDDVTVGSLTAQHVLFAEADHVQGLGPSFFFGHFDAVLGMGLPATSTHGLKPMMQTFIEQKLIEKWVFAFYLSSDDSVDGELTLGGYDSNRIDGPIVYTPVVDKRYWMINSQGLRVKEDIISRTTRAIIDSGTSLIAGPLDEVDKIARMFGAFSLPMLPKGTYLISCDKALILEDIALMVEGHKFTISARDLVIQVSDINGVPCLFGIIGLQILEGRTHHRAPHDERMSTADKQQFDTVQQDAAGSRENLLTRVLREEALLTGSKHQAQQQRSRQGASGSGVFLPARSEGNPAESSVKAVYPVDGEVIASARLTDLGRLWIFGDVFMRGAYTIFDYDEGRIGFAKLKKANN